jgi:hypothetical protein
MVVDRILQDALEQQGQLSGRPIGIILRQLEHRLLHDVERRVLVANGVHRLLEGAPLDLREKARDFLFVSQFARFR